MSDQPIGVFDSGVGGLTVVRALQARLPNENIVYFGDTARVPYGTKSASTVTRYARACTAKLLEFDVKLIVVACNTASAYALSALQEALPIPVIGVVEPGARAAAAATRNQRIGVIGTTGTIESDTYQRSLRESAPKAEVFVKPCPLFVPLAEEGWTDGPVPRQAAEEYLREFRNHDIDTLVLGCTHYPLLTAVIAGVTGESVTLVDSGEATAAVVEDVLNGMRMRREDPTEGQLRCMVSDVPNGFAAMGSRFLARRIEHVDWIDF